MVENIKVLTEALELLRSHGIEAWVHGGYALDLYTGTTRPHADIDLLADESTRAKFKKLFRERIKVEASHKVEIEYEDQELEVTFFERQGARLLTWTPRIVVQWPPDTLGAPKVQVEESSIPVVSPSALYMELANTVLKKKPMLEKNQRDLERFGELLTQQEKQAVERYFPRENNFLNRMRLRLGM